MPSALYVLVWSPPSVLPFFTHTKGPLHHNGKRDPSTQSSQQNRYAWIPQVFSLLVLIGSAGRNFNTSLQSIGPPGTVAANRCSFFALQFSVAVSFSVIGADFYVYYRTLLRRHSFFFVVPVCFVRHSLRAAENYFHHSCSREWSYSYDSVACHKMRFPLLSRPYP